MLACSAEEGLECPSVRLVLKSCRVVVFPKPFPFCSLVAGPFVTVISRRNSTSADTTRLRAGFRRKSPRRVFPCFLDVHCTKSIARCIQLILTSKGIQGMARCAAPIVGGLLRVCEPRACKYVKDSVVQSFQNHCNLQNLEDKPYFADARLFFFSFFNFVQIQHCRSWSPSHLPASTRGQRYAVARHSDEHVEYVGQRLVP